MAKIQNKSWLDRRNQTNPFERIWSDEWRKACKSDGWSFGQWGLLQQLFMQDSVLGMWPGVPEIVINDRDALVAATVIQWLGTNVGHCWLEETLKKSGYKLSINDNYKPLQEEHNTPIFARPYDPLASLEKWDGRVIHAEHSWQYKEMIQLNELGLILWSGKVTKSAKGLEGKCRARVTLKGREALEARKKRGRGLNGDHRREQYQARRLKRSR